METEQLKKLTESVEQITKDFTELKNAGELAQKGATAAKSEVEKLAESLGKQVEEMQAKQSRIEAAIQRPGVQGSEDEQKALAAQESKALNAYLRSGEERELKALSTDSNPDGGYWVPTHNLGVINGRIFETSPMRRIANVRATATKSVTFYLDDQEGGATWEGEGTSNPSTTTPQIGELEIVAKKLTAEPSVTEEDLQDSAFDVEAWLNRKGAEKFGRTENTAFVNGNGVTAPRGLLTYSGWNTPGTYQRNALERMASGSTSAISEANLIDMQGMLIEDYQNNATWAMNRGVLTSIMKLAGSTNFRFLNLQPATGPQGQVLGAVMSLLEKPVVLMADMPAISSGTLSVAYGDFSRGYSIVDRVGITVLRDPYTAKGRIKYRVMKRVGGAVTNFEAIKLLQMSNSL